MSAAKKPKPDDPTLARHRQATHEYAILEHFEAGIALMGTEVKALRAGRAQLREGYVRIEKNEAWLIGVTISQFEQGNINNHEPTRKRRLLLHRREIDYLDGKVRLGGLTLVPLRLYLSNNRVKLEFGLARGKKLWDKRQDLAKREADRDIQRATARVGRS